MESSIGNGNGNSNLYVGPGANVRISSASDTTSKSRSASSQRHANNVNSTTSAMYNSVSGTTQSSARASPYPNELSVGAALMRSSATSTKVFINPTIVNGPSAIRSSCSSPYLAKTNSMVLQNISRESPSVTPNQGSTTPTNSQSLASNSHSSPRPSILSNIFNL